MNINLNFRKKKSSVKALIVYPNKQIEIAKVSFEDGRFNRGKTTYLVDENAIYYHKNEPFMFYKYGIASPIIITITGTKPSMSAEEIKSVIESKAVSDLMTASAGGEGWVLYVAAAAAALSLLSVLIQFGVIKTGVN